MLAVWSKEDGSEGYLLKNGRESKNRYAIFNTFHPKWHVICWSTTNGMESSSMHIDNDETGSRSLQKGLACDIIPQHV